MSIKKGVAQIKMHVDIDMTQVSWSNFYLKKITVKSKQGTQRQIWEWLQNSITASVPRAVITYGRVGPTRRVAAWLHLHRNIRVSFKYIRGGCVWLLGRR